MNHEAMIDDIIKTAQQVHLHLDKKIYNSKIIDFPTLRQAFSYSCGASALQVILLYYGIDMRESDLIGKVGTSDNGTDNLQIIEFLKTLGFKVQAGEGNTIDKLKKLVDKGIPCMIPIQAWAEKETKGWHKNNDNGHYVVVIGYTDQHLIFSDPADIQDTALSYDELEERWHDTDVRGKVLDHYAIVPYGKKPHFHSTNIKKMGRCVPAIY